MRQSSHTSTNVAVSDYAKRQPCEFRSLISRPIFPSAFRAGVDPRSDPPHDVEHQRKRVLGYGARVESGSKDDRNIPAGGFGRIDIVESDSHTANQAKFRKRMHQGFRDEASSAGQYRPNLA